MSGRPMDHGGLDGIANMFAGDKRIEALLASHDYWEAEAKRLAAEIDDAKREVTTLASELGGLEVEWLQALSAATTWEAEAKRWRSRCPVTVEDVEAVTGDQIVAWALATGDWHDVPWSREHVRVLQLGTSQEQIMIGVGLANGWIDAPRTKADTVRRLAEWQGRPAQDVLEEMAAMEVDP